MLRARQLGMAVTGFEKEICFQANPSKGMDEVPLFWGSFPLSCLAFSNYVVSVAFALP